MKNSPFRRLFAVSEFHHPLKLIPVLYKVVSTLCTKISATVVDMKREQITVGLQNRLPMEDPPSVCVVTHPITEIGDLAVTSLLEVISACASSVYLITANLPEDSEIRDKYGFSEISSKGMGGPIYVAAIRFVLNQLVMCREIHQRDENIVLFFGSTSYLLPILYARRTGKKVVLEPRGNVPDALYGKWKARMPDSIAYMLTIPVRVLERAGYASSHAILTLSPQMTDDLRLRRYSEKLHEHGARPVDVDRFSSKTPYEERDKVGYLGRLDDEKGVDVLVEVVKELSEEHRFIFVGGGPLQELIETELQERIEDGSVQVTGWVDHSEVPEYLNELHLMLMTSRTEGVPTTALESMACGTPVCASPVGGIPDVITDGETGFLLERQTPQEIAERLEEILERDDLGEISRSARKFVVDNYGFDAVVEEYRSVFDTVAE